MLLVGECACQHDGKGRAILKKFGDVFFEGFQLFGFAQGKCPQLRAGPFAQNHGGADFHASDTQGGHQLDGFPDGVDIAFVQAGGDVDRIASLLKKPEGIQGSLLAAVYATQEIMLPHTVKAELEGGLDAHGFQSIQKLFIYQPAVGVNAVDADAPLDKRLHDLQKIRTNERLTAGDSYLVDAAFYELVHGFHELGMGGVAVLAIGGRHKAVAAFEIAVAGDGPVHLPFVAAGILLIFLAGKQGFAKGSFPQDAVFQGDIQEFLHRLGKVFSVYAVKAIALGKELKVLLIQKYGRLAQGVENGVGNFVPTAQPVSFVKNVVH